MAKIEASDLIRRIDEGLSKAGRETPRSYIGASVIGNSCDAYLAMSLRGYPDEAVEPRLQRIFRDGHRIEDQVVRDLSKAGYHVQEVDPLTGKQWHYEELGGHVACNADGHIDDGDEVALLEIKSMNANKFDEFKRFGVAISHPHYRDQVIMLMALSGIKDGVFVAYDKTTSEYWMEVIPYDEDRWNYLQVRIQSILDGARQRVAKEEVDWRCRGGFKRGVCCGHRDPLRVCKSCVHATPHNDGSWWCMKHDQRAEETCDDYDAFLPKPRP